MNSEDESNKIDSATSPAGGAGDPEDVAAAAAAARPAGGGVVRFTSSTPTPGEQLRRRRSMHLEGMVQGQLSTKKLNFAIPSNEGAQDHVHETHGNDSWRYKTLSFLHSTPVQRAIFCMLILDVIILFVELSLVAAYPNCNIIIRDAISCCPADAATNNVTGGVEGNGHLLLRFLEGGEAATPTDDHGGSGSGSHHSNICESEELLLEPSPEYGAGCDPHKWHTVHTAETVLFAITMTILSLMMLELNLAMIALTPQVFFRQFFYAIDYFIVAVSITLEAVFHSLSDDYLQSIIGLLIFFRLWRFIRIAHGLVSITAEVSHSHYEELLAYTEGKGMKTVVCPPHSIGLTRDR